METFDNAASRIDDLEGRIHGLRLDIADLGNGAPEQASPGAFEPAFSERPPLKGGKPQPFDVLKVENGLATVWLGPAYNAVVMRNGRAVAPVNWYSSTVTTPLAEGYALCVVVGSGTSDSSTTSNAWAVNTSGAAALWSFSAKPLLQLGTKEIDFSACIPVALMYNGAVVQLRRGVINDDAFLGDSDYYRLYRALHMRADHCLELLDWRSMGADLTLDSSTSWGRVQVLVRSSDSSGSIVLRYAKIDFPSGSGGGGGDSSWSSWLSDYSSDWSSWFSSWSSWLSDYSSDSSGDYWVTGGDATTCNGTSALLDDLIVRNALTVAGTTATWGQIFYVGQDGSASSAWVLKG